MSINELEAFTKHITSSVKDEQYTICIRDVKTGVEEDHLLKKVIFDNSIIFIYKNYSQCVTTLIFDSKHEAYYARLIFYSSSQNGKYKVFIK